MAEQATILVPETMIAMGIAEPGGPEMLQPTELPVPQPGPGQVLVRVSHAGVNRPDVIQRQGFYPPPPGASATGEPAPQSGGGLLSPMTSPIGSAGTGSSGEASIGPDGRPVTPKGRDRPFILDGLLN